jgi:hypothetical protein
MGRSLAACFVALVLAGCARTNPLDDDTDGGLDAGSIDRPGFDAGPDSGRDGAPVPIGCAPAGDEGCNGTDDDCDGEIDEDLVPMVCEGGGTRLCIAGRWSACPRRCEHCIPGSERICFLSYCTYWGVQTCAADGRAFGPCAERRAPDECLSIALNRRDSPELEQCCVDNAYCCSDKHDLDGDGDRAESLGSCEGVLCGP